jgi:adenosine deaminase
MSATSDEVNDNNHKNNDFHDFIKRLPKVELHAHLNGCIRETTLFELAKDRGVTLGEHHFAEEPIADDHSMYNVRPRSLQDCFDMFAEIPKCVDDLAALARIATEALEDFSLHHVVYLELRSTPKQLLVKSGGTEIADKQQYCLSIINSMKDFERRDEERYNQEQANGVPSPRLPMICRFLVAVDRSQSVEDALEHVQLAEILKNEHNEIIVGVDLGGNPTKVSANVFAREPTTTFSPTWSSRTISTISEKRSKEPERQG